MHRIVFASVVVSLALGCNKDDSEPDDPDPTPSAWLVGADGEMHRITEDGDLAGYPLHEDDDLLAIACIGHASAWVVGSDGTVLRSRDAGIEWDVVDVATDADLHALAVASGTPEGDEALWIVGADGVARFSPDGGASWAHVTVPTRATLTGVATDPQGDVALAVANDGSIWRLQDASATRIHGASTALHAIAWGGPAIAVGEHGTMLVSNDAGTTWSTISLPTTRDLFAVQITRDGSRVHAVGEAGVIVTHDAASTSAVELLPPGLALHGLHLTADGHGHAVGDAGTVLATDDAGAHWTPLPVATDATLHGIDDFHAPHA